MRIHVLLAVSDDGLSRKLELMLATEDVVIDRVDADVGRWQKLANKAGDILVIERSLLKRPISQTLEVLAGLPEAPFVVVLTEREDPDDGALLTTYGCTAVLSMEATDEHVQNALVSLVARKRDSLAQQHPTEEPGDNPKLRDFISISPTMQVFMATVQRVAGSNASLLITGETGVGKEHLARAIHQESMRKDGPFLAINCGAIPESLLESELFGHEKGAFTGATRNHRGWFECAHNGTLFLDEIGELPLHLQVRLLRVLQFREIRRVGSEREIKVDVRIMAATNRDPERDVANGTFRADLYYRLSVIQLPIPSLRSRREDIQELAARLLWSIGEELGRRNLSFTDRAKSALETYDWPGNVRELRNVLERGILLSHEDAIDIGSFPIAVSRNTDNIAPIQIAESSAQEPNNVPLTLPEARAACVAEFEARYIQDMLQETEGKINECAERAGITTRSLYQKMKTYGIHKEQFKPRRG
ncbi:MAG: two-component system response regulator AtoC [Planctomycetota bacterium]|jgi:two-component system response regulator AtoC